MRFRDVVENAWYSEAVRWAAANGIVNGYTEQTFGPNDNIAREQLAAILHRYANYKGYDVSVGEDTNILSFDDAQTISGYAVPAMQWACGAGLMRARTGSFCPPRRLHAHRSRLCCTDSSADTQALRNEHRACIRPVLFPLLR